MKLNTAKEDFFIVFVSFWTTILITRYWTFQYFKIFQEYPLLYIGNIPVHHFFIGLILVSLVLLLRTITNKFTFLALVFLGIGLALITDEFWLLFTGNFTIDNVYWATQNLLAIVLIGLASMGVMKLLEWRRDKFILHGNSHYHKNPKNPFVTVVVPALNEEKFLERNLISLIEQNYKNFEIIVVDNNSSDKTAEIAKKYGARVIFNEEKGVGASRQKGFLEAKGKIIATTDADNILPPNWLSRIVYEFEKNEKLVAFGGIFRLYSGPLSARIAVKYFTYPVFKFDKLITGDWSLIAQNMAVKKDAFKEVGGFKHVQIGEDADLSKRLSSIGQVVLDPNFIVYASGRRARHGIWYGALTYAPNSFSRMFFKKHKFDKLPTVREEKSMLTKLSFIPLVISIFYLLLLFSSMNANLEHARKNLMNKTSASISSIKLKEFAQELTPINSSWSGILKHAPTIMFFERN